MRTTIVAAVYASWTALGRNSEQETKELLHRHAWFAERHAAVDRVPLTDGQFDALCSFAFNPGGGALQRSTLRRKVNREEHALVPAEFRKWVWSGGRPEAEGANAAAGGGGTAIRR